jgi:hypothetical protein
MNPLTYNEDGTVSWRQIPGDLYHITGVHTNGRRFPTIVTDNWYQANGINLYRGSVWLVRDNKRFLIRRVFN